MVNSSYESSKAINAYAETTLKTYTSGDAMSFRRKFKEPVDTVPTAKIMIATNELPKFHDKTHGVWRRMLFVPFEKTYAENQQNKNLADELTKELPGIFNWAFKGMKMLRAAGCFITPTKCKEAVEEYRRNVNPARAFLQDNYAEGFEFAGRPCSEVYDIYLQWCTNYGYKLMDESNFGKEVRRAFPKVKKERQRSGAKRIQIYTALAVREGSEITHPDFWRDSIDSGQRGHGGHRKSVFKREKIRKL